MKKFSIEYHETYGRTYEIEANSPEEAEEILRDMICNGEVVLCQDLVQIKMRSSAC